MIYKYIIIDLKVLFQFKRGKKRLIQDQLFCLHHLHAYVLMNHTCLCLSYAIHEGVFV